MIRDIQINPFSNEILTTALQEYEMAVNIPHIANYPDKNPNMFIVFLDEIPYLQDRVNFPIEVKLHQDLKIFKEVTGPPGEDEYRIAPWGSGRPNAIQFNPANAGDPIIIKYWGWGSVVTYKNYVSKNGGDIIEGDLTLRGRLISDMIQSKNFSPTREIFGLKLTSVSNTEINFSIGYCFDDTLITNPFDCKIIRNLNSVTRAINFKFGTAHGMLLGDPEQKYLANSSYLIYIIAKEDGTSNFLAVLSTDPFAYPSPEYVRKRRIGIIMTDAQKKIVQFNHFPEIKTYFWKNKITTSLYTVYQSEISYYIYVPKGINLIPIFNLNPGRPQSGKISNLGFRGIERDYYNFSIRYPNEYNFDSEIGSFFQQGLGNSYIENNFINYFCITDLDGRIYIQNKNTGDLVGNSLQIYGFVDFLV